MLKLLTRTILLISIVFIGYSGEASSTKWDKNDHVSTRIISAVDGVGDLVEIPLGLEFQLKPGWKIYWRTPGDAGLPPILDWSKSKNVENVDFFWPLPHRFSVLGLETLGYKDQVVFPLVITPKTQGRPIYLKGDISYLACAEICIPYTTIIDFKLDLGPANSTKQAHLIDKYLAQVPSDATANGLTVETASQQIAGDNFTLQLVIGAGRKISNPDVFVEGAEGLFFSAPEIRYGANNVALTLNGGGVPVAEFEGQPLKITLYDDAGMTELLMTPQSGLVAFDGNGNNDAPTIFAVILLAILGGLILNLMPCVLPVLSLKLLSVVRHGGSKKRDVRIGFIATSVGIISAFLMLAALLISLKMSGMAIGWGIQFQQPIFLIVMVMLLTLFAANMFGLFEFYLPGRLADIAANSGLQKGLLGHFATGAFATLLATPCSTPFLGTAVGFALSRGPVEIFTIFAALGFGLALPYLLVAITPRLATSLPKPGLWMMKLKYILGLAILATALWLLSVLVALMGLENTLFVGSFSILILAVLLAKSLPNSKLGHHAGKAVVALIIAAIFVPIFRPIILDTKTNANADDIWIAFDEGAIQDYIMQDKTVFVDVTADWCITCKFNKKTVMEASDIADWLASPNVIAMRADWTKANQDIADYLTSFGRYGIPFNAVYGPDNSLGIRLPELLSRKDIVKASAEVSKNNHLADN